MSGADTPRVDAIVESPMPLTAANIIMAKDELVRLARQLERELSCAQENFHVTNQAYVKADARAEKAERELAQSQARCAELEKDAARYTWLANALCGDNGDAIGLCLDADSLHLSKEAFDASVDAALTGHTPK